MSGIGANVSQFPIPGSQLRKDALLFGESQSRIIITCKKGLVAKIEALAKKNNVFCQRIGTVGGKSLKIQGLIDLPVEKIKESWSTALK